ncbi:helix-turn-helix domain-containing protein [Flavobacteriaceae bacterium R38]|nr:helix-turn-helix domain-containing protein [Flavobacteriaceae bacterium R38]
MIFKKLLPWIFLFNITSLCYSQEASFKIPDSLKQKTYSELIRDINNSSKLHEEEVYAHAYLQKAKNEKDTLSIAEGFQIYTLIYDDDRVLQYADSIVEMTKEDPNAFYPATGYLVKGIHYYGQRNFINALDNYLLANKYANEYKNEQLFYKSNYSIGILKDRIGEYEESISIHRKNYNYAKKNIDFIDEDDYLVGVFALASAFMYLKDLDSASYYNRYGFKEANRLNNDLKNIFVLGEGITQFYKKNYNLAFDSINKARLYLEERNAKPNMAMAYYYLGKISEAIDEKEEMVWYLKKVDTIFQETRDIFPRTRDTYNLLTNYYRGKSDLEQQLVYIQKLIEVDSVLNSNHIYLSKNIIEKYDVPKLINEKEELIKVLKKDKNSLGTVILIVSSVALIIGFWLYRRQRIFKKKFEVLLEKNNEVISSKKSDLNPLKETIDVPLEIAEDILQELQKFEKEYNYTDTSITLSSLAISFKTNTNYLSKTINFYKGKSFPLYLNELRIQYALEKLKTDALFRKYTIKAIANETGFKSPETFSKFFYKLTGVYPSYFIKQMDKLERV